MKLIYIAGPYRPYTCADGTWVGTSMNTRNAEVTAVNLVNELGHLGLFPVVPHLNTRGFESQVKKNSDQYFLDGTMAILERCDAVLLTMPNADVVSVGTKAEVHRAHQLGIQVYRSFDSLRRAAEAGQIVRLPIQLILLYPTRLQEFMHHLRPNEDDMRRHLLQMSPDTRQVWDTDGPLTVYDFAKLEDHVLSRYKFPGLRSCGQSISIQMSEPPFVNAGGKGEMEVELQDENGNTAKVIARKGADGKTWTAKCGSYNYEWEMFGDADIPDENAVPYHQKIKEMEECILASFPETHVEAINLRPGDTLKNGDVVNSTEQLEGMVIKVNWANGTSGRYHYAEIFKVVMRRTGGIRNAK